MSFTETNDKLLSEALRHGRLRKRRVLRRSRRTGIDIPSVHHQDEHRRGVRVRPECPLDGAELPADVEQPPEGPAGHGQVVLVLGRPPEPVRVERLGRPGPEAAAEGFTLREAASVGGIGEELPSL